jgi:hypothetical protein
MKIPALVIEGFLDDDGSITMAFEDWVIQILDVCLN